MFSVKLLKMNKGCDFLTFSPFYPDINHEGTLATLKALDMEK